MAHRVLDYGRTFDTLTEYPFGCIFMSTLHDQMVDAFKSLDHQRLKKLVQKDDLRQTIKLCIEKANFFNKKTLPMLETLFAHNTVDQNFHNELFSSIVMKHYDVSRLILKYSPATFLDRILLHSHMPPDDIYREYAVRAVRNCSSDNFGIVPEILCRAETSDTMLAILREIPQSYEVDKHFMDALMHRQYPQAIAFAVSHLIGANPDLATDVILFILSGELGDDEDLDYLIPPLLNTYPPNAQQCKWISSSISPGYIPIPVLDELLKHYIVEDDARLLLEASGSKNPIVFSKVVDFFTEEQARKVLDGTKALQIFTPKTFGPDRELLRQHIEHLDNMKQQQILTDAINFPAGKTLNRKI